MVLAVATVTACTTVSEKKDPLAKNVIDEADLVGLMLSAGDPEEAVTFFEGALAEEPGRSDYRRGLAMSLARAGRHTEAARVYQELIALDQARPADRLEYGFIAARLDMWEDVRVLVRDMPPGLNTERRFTLEGMLADHDQSWPEADAAYAKAEQLSTDPANVLNNWGVSRMSRGDMPGAEKSFRAALSYDSRLFNAKNNLAIVRGLQGNFRLPVVPMTETEKAMILYNLGIIALRKDEKRIAKGLFTAAVESHPQHYRAAADRLASLDASVVQ